MVEYQDPDIYVDNYHKHKHVYQEWFYEHYMFENWLIILYYNQERKKERLHYKHFIITFFCLPFTNKIPSETTFDK